MASGHTATAAAAGEVLAIGGNAFDACVAGGFASAMAEPWLTGLAGGGFLLARTAKGEEVLFDFFVDTPGRGAPTRSQGEGLDFEEVVVQFSGVGQGFHVGLASVAVPGCLAGWLHVHRRLGRLPLDAVIAPARRLAAEGVLLNEQQAAFLRILAPILTRTPEAAALVAPGGRLLDLGDRFANPELAAFLDELDPAGFAAPAVARRAAQAMRAGGGLLTEDDLRDYQVIERPPLVVAWGGHRLLTNPPPAFGGELVALGLLLLDERPEWPAPHGSVAHAVAIAETMVATNEVRAAGLVGPALARRRASGGTTHISVSDAEGNVATMTTSNGEGSGWVIPGTGVVANNMMGEDDLHPRGFHASRPGERVASMMAPSIVVDEDGAVRLVLGSGGSKRIRTALLQVVAAAIDQGVPLAAAVEAPRLHWDGEVLHAEPGWAPEVLTALEARWPVVGWAQPDVYFGGVHAVVPGTTAAGDQRRGGATLVT
ncbi:MAG: gamma-glutamyltransferase [Acidimicrobiales bacterium]|nr:gamma-glutamyltransferase [Acidimicrobiales bacterium]